MQHILLAFLLSYLSWGAEQAQAESIEHRNKFISYVSGHLTNENQNILDPKNFPLVVAEHCGVAVVNSTSSEPQMGFLYQIGEKPNRRRMVFTVSLRPDGTLDLASRRILDGAKIATDLCQESADKRVISEESLKPSTCHVYYQYDGTEGIFRGSTPPEGCPSTFMGAVVMHVKEVVSDGRLEIEERWLDASGKQVAGSTAGPYVYLRKPQFTGASSAQYSCWAALKKPDGTYTLDRSIVNDRGGKFSTSSIVSSEGETLSYDIKLDRVSFNNNIPVLKLGIYKSGNDRSILYLWAEVGARLIGTNVTWIQVGCTRTE
jgi:hypothetical protein